MGLLIVMYGFYAMILAPFFLLGLAFPYAILRVRDAQMEQRDNQVGIKAGLYYFLSISVYLILSGLTVIVIDLTKEEKPAGPQEQMLARMMQADDFEALRFGTGLVISGTIFLAAHFALIRFMTNDARFPATRHVYNGWRFAISGLVVMFSLTALIVIMLQKDDLAELKRSALSTLVVWCPAWLIDLSLLNSRRKLPYCTTRMFAEPPEAAPSEATEH